MRITKLHILIFLVLIASGFFGLRYIKTKQLEKKQREEKIALQQKLEEEKMKQLAEEQMASQKVDVSTASAQSQKKQQAPVTYTVKRGDTLWSIARKKEHFSKGHKWYDIWKANEDRLPDFDRIVSGQVLTIPLDKSADFFWPKTSDGRKNKILTRSNPQSLATRTSENENPQDRTTPGENGEAGPDGSAE